MYEDEFSVSGSSAEFGTDRENQEEETLCRQLSEKSLNHSRSDCASSSISDISKFNISQVSQGKDEIVLGAGEDSDGICKEVRCVEMDESVENKNSESVDNSENNGRISMLSASPTEDSVDQELLPDLPRQARGTVNGFTYGALEQKMQDVQKAFDSLLGPNRDERPSWDTSADMSSSRSLRLTRSMSCRANIMAGSSSSPDREVEQIQTTPPNGLEKHFPGRPVSVRRKHWNIPPLTFGENAARLSRNNSQSSIGSAFLDDLKSENPGDEDIPSVDNFVAGLKEMAKHQYGNKMDDQVRVIYVLAVMRFHPFLPLFCFERMLILFFAGSCLNVLFSVSN